MNFTTEMTFAGAACASALAIAAVLRPRRNLPDWAFSAGMVALGAESIFAGLTARARWVPNMVSWQSWHLFSGAFLPGFWLLFSLAYARGNAREFVKKWRYVVAGVFLVPIGIAAFFRDGLIASVRDGGIGSSWPFRLGWAGSTLNFLVLAGSILILLNLERTYRASVGTMRWRIKFMLMGIGLIFLVRVYTTSQGLLFHGTDLAMQSLNSGAVIVAAFLVVRSFVRSRSIELDVYPSHSALQGSFTILLAGTYLLIVGVIARVVARIGGSNVFALEALVILVSLVLLVVLLQSDRLKMRLGRFLSRHFQRPLFDYRTVWRKFTESTASQVRQDELCRSIVRQVSELFRSLSVAIWLRDDKSLTLAASTRLSENQARNLAPSAAQAAAILEQFRQDREPVDIESSKSEWAALLRLMHPCEFPGKENRVCVPLIARDDVAGVMMLGDRVDGAAFTSEDYDMLTCAGDHAAASILNVQLSQKLLQAKEFEAFQTMAAFVVHDLKNAASTLSLMLENMRVHFQDPAFREDALRGISKSVDHINHVIGRLSLLRHELKIRPVDTDLNEIVRESVAGLESKPEFEIEKEFSSLPKLSLDREHIGKVVTNLVLNAKESMSGKGRVHLATSRDRGWVVLSVRDRGCGMTPEFIERSLFRPFQTTKENGLGIGMFQSKMIVEMHGGRIAAESESGVGTTFRIFLPLQRKIG